MFQTYVAMPVLLVEFEPKPSNIVLPVLSVLKKVMLLSESGVPFSVKLAVNVTLE
jgi:hypothetical protein